MKTLKPLLFLSRLALSCLGAHAADFEGTIRWTMSIEITDPAIKKQMADAEKQMSDPKMQEQMKEAQAAMADPQMQAMMAQNPQMKAMMEQQMAMMNKAPAGGGNPMAAMFPKGMTLRTKAGKSLTVIEGGPMPTEVLNLPAVPASYMIDRSARAYTKLPADVPAGAVSEKVNYKVTKTGETAQVIGYACTKYIVEATAPTAASAAARPGSESPSRYVVWASTAVPGLDTRALAKVRFSQRGADNAFLGQIDGVPLKMEITAPEARVTMQAASIKAESLADGLFALPAGFTERALAPGRP
jgi:hypothetical protein